MTVKDDNVASFSNVVLELNVPDLRYLSDSNLVDQTMIDHCTTHFLSSGDDVENLSTVAELRRITEGQSLPAFVNNSAFISDRIFDVWLRKNQLEPEINQILGRWRFVYAAMLWHSAPEFDGANSALVKLMELVAESLLGWSPRPERNKKLVLERLIEIESMLFSRLALESSYVEELAEQWQTFSNKQQEKVDKLNDRLILAESSASKMRESERTSSHYFNQIFAGKTLSTAMIDFVSEYWLRAYALASQQSDNPAYLEQADKLNKILLAVFYGKGESVFNHSEQLTDELIELTEKLGVSVPPKVWQGLQQDMICMMQGQFYNEAEFLPIPTDHTKVSESFVAPKEGTWLKLKRDEEWDRVYVLRFFDAAEELLLVNYLGMKVALFHREDFELLKKQKLVQVIPAAPKLGLVITTALNGLMKVANAQKNERKKAAEKALSEAKALQAAKAAAEEKAKMQAEEISKRAAELKSRMEEKQRLNQERKVLSDIQEMKLGAWIAINGGDVKKRYKLIVKLAATQKYIFVDKLGIAKKEFVESDLLAAVLDGQIDILSDGAEFEESLERVVSRIRISR